MGDFPGRKGSAPVAISKADQHRDGSSVDALRDTSPLPAMVALRNGLTHFKPEWDNEQVAHAKLSQQLAHRFMPSPFLAAGESIFPRCWATHGCTQWALKSCVDLL